MIFKLMIFRYFKAIFILKKKIIVLMAYNSRAKSFIILVRLFCINHIYRTDWQCRATHCWWALRGWQTNRCTKNEYGGFGLRDSGFSCPINKVYRPKSPKVLCYFLQFYTIRFQRVQVKSRRDHRERNLDGKLFWLLEIKTSRWAIPFRDILYLSQGRLCTNRSTIYPFSSFFHFSSSSFMSRIKLWQARNIEYSHT